MSEDDPLDDAFVEEDEDPLDDLVQDAQEYGEQYSEARKKISQVKEKLRDLISKYEDEEVISRGKADDLREMVDESKYEKVRSQLREAKQGVDLEFDDEEKKAFAEAFQDTVSEIEENMELISTELLSLEDHGFDSNDDLIAFIFGKHSSVRKGDLEKVFDAIDEASNPDGFSRKQKAKLLQAFEPSLNIKPTKKILKLIEEEAR